jgi:hypothetical protein
MSNSVSPVVEVIVHPVLEAVVCFHPLIERRAIVG